MASLEDALGAAVQDVGETSKKQRQENQAAPAVTALFVPLDDIEPDPDQPRKFTEGGTVDENLALMAESILQHGVLQPISVKPLGEGKYQIVTGERRWRASKLAMKRGEPCKRRGYDLERIPVHILEPASDSDKLEMQLVENLARSDMSPEDIGNALQRLLDDTRLSKEALARRLGRSATWVKNLLARANPEAQAMAERLGVSMDEIGSNEMARMLAWSRDANKCVVIDRVSARLQVGETLTRNLLVEEEDRYEIEVKLELQDRGLSLEDLRKVRDFVQSEKPEERGIATRVRAGMSLAEAYAMPSVTHSEESVEDGPRQDPAHGDYGKAAAGRHMFFPDSGDAEGTFESMGDAHELQEAAFAARRAGEMTRQVTRPAVNAGTETRGTTTFEGASARESTPIRDAATASSAADGYAPLIVVRVPQEIAAGLLEKAGRADMELSGDAVLEALRLILTQ
nr:ParB/RepB/Spo0J family partition protein [Acidithiobacillus ferruginosus]